MKLGRELKGNELIFTLLLMLLGDEGVDFSYYEADTDWWVLRLFTRRN